MSSLSILEGEAAPTSAATDAAPPAAPQIRNDFLVQIPTVTSLPTTSPTAPPPPRLPATTKPTRATGTTRASISTRSTTLLKPSAAVAKKNGNRKNTKKKVKKKRSNVSPPSSKSRTRPTGAAGSTSNSSQATTGKRRKAAPKATKSTKSVGSVGSQAAKAQALKLRGSDNSRLAHSVLTKTNFLIQTAEVRAEPITSLRELEQCAASMFVAIFESMFRVRLRGIVREPQRLQDYAQNAQLVIDAISSAFHVDIRHINGNLICDGHRASISTLVDVFIEILTEKVSSRRGRSRSRSEERQHIRESGSSASGRSRTEGLLDVAATRRRRPTSAPPTERRTVPRNTATSQEPGSSKNTKSAAKKKKKKKTALKKKLKRRHKPVRQPQQQQQQQNQPQEDQPPHATNEWLDDDASQLVMDESSTMSLSNRQNVSAQYLAAAAMAAATAALEAHASHDVIREEPSVSDNEIETSIPSNGHSRTEELNADTIGSEQDDMEQSPLWEAQEESTLLFNEPSELNLDDNDLHRVLNRIASLDTTSVAGSAIAKPLWDILIRSGSLAEKKTTSSGSNGASAGNGGRNGGGGGGSSSSNNNNSTNKTSPTKRRQIRQTEIRNRHRMYKKLLKAQIKALKIEEHEESAHGMSLGSSVDSMDGNFSDAREGFALDSLQSSSVGPSSLGTTFALRSSSDAHQARVELIRETRLKKELRRAAKAKLIRRKRREELVVDKLFTGALKEERRRLAIERAETKRAQKIEEQSRQEKLHAIEHQYTEHRKMLAEQERQQEYERKIAEKAQKFEFKSMARELRDEKRKRFTQLIEQLDRQDQQDQSSDFVAGLGTELKGPGMSEKLRVLLTKFTKASVPEPKTERLSWLRTRTNRSKGSPTKRLSKRRARQKKVTLLRNCYGQH